MKEGIGDVYIYNTLLFSLSSWLRCTKVSIIDNNLHHDNNQHFLSNPLFLLLLLTYTHLLYQTTHTLHLFLLLHLLLPLLTIHPLLLLLMHYPLLLLPFSLLLLLLIYINRMSPRMVVVVFLWFIIVGTT